MPQNAARVPSPPSAAICGSLVILEPLKPRSNTPVMLEALCDHLLEKPGLYLDEMALFL